MRLSSPVQREKMNVHIVAGRSAELLLTDGEFQEAWKHLFEACPWATGFQSSGFVTTWYRIYRPHFLPVIVTDFAKGAEMSGLLTLATCKESGELVVAGTHQAEYQGWLAFPPSSDSFIRQALTELRSAFPGRSLSFKYLPPRTPIEWAAVLSGAGIYCSIKAGSRALIALSESSRLKDDSHFRKRIKRLGRDAELSFQKIEDSELFNSALESLIPEYDLRQGAVNGAVPFRDDPLKKAFHFELLKVPNLTHAVALKLGDTFIAVHLGFCSRDAVCLGVMAYRISFAKHSPGTLVIKMLELQLAKDGYRYLDLTPDGQYKERFANEHDVVYKLRIFFKRSDFVRCQAKEELRNLPKRILMRCGARPESLSRFLEKLRSLPLSESPLRILNSLVSKLWRQDSLSIYVCHSIAWRCAEQVHFLSRDRIEELLAWEPADSSLSRQYFYAKCLRRIENGLRAYSRVERGRLVFCGWMTERHEKVVLPEVQPGLGLPPRSALIFDLYSDSQNMEFELIKSALRQMFHDAASLAGIGQIYVLVDAKETVHRQLVEELALTYVRSFLKTTIFGYTILKTNSDAGGCVGLPVDVHIEKLR